MTDRKYGWRPSLPDHRDLLFEEVVAPSTPPPPSADNSHFCDGPWDQGQVGSCTGNGFSMLYVAASRHQGFTAVADPSRLFVYYNARLPEGTTGQDAGATCRDACKALITYGAPSETLWTYDPRHVTTKPNAKAYQSGQAHQGLQYLSVTQNALLMKQALAAGYCIGVGISVYESFESDQVARTGLVPLPGKGEKLLGGHCILLVGYDENDPHTWKLINSWGAGWGQGGYFRLPLTYLTNPRLSGDFWTLHTTEG